MDTDEVVLNGMITKAYNLPSEESKIIVYLCNMLKGDC